MVGATGFEPVTPCAQGRCATRLRYAPTSSIVNDGEISKKSPTHAGGASPSGSNEVSCSNPDTR